MFRFTKARSPNETLSDLENFLRQNSDEPIEFLSRTVDDWRKISYDDLEAAIAAGKLDELIDWQSRYAAVVNEKFSPLWLAAMQTAALKATLGRITIDDSDFRVKDFLRTRGAELVTQLSDESRKAVAAIILHGQENMIPPKKIAQQIRPLIGLNARQAQANVNYRERIFSRFVEQGLSATTANQRADKAALKYASKQHRQRAETIVHTELARAYNQGAHEGILTAQRAGLMGRCEMVWSTAGTNRVCGRCLSLKDTVVGHTDESGVTLPPLHPRCRCTIIYRETTNKPKDNPPAPKNPLTAPERNGNVVGALNEKNDPEGKRRDAHAEKFYAARRNSKKEPWVKRIAKNSGMREKSIAKIFDHVFITEHDLYDGHHRFPADYYMAESFRRLSEGKDIQPHDLILLKHEWLELSLMKRYGYDYDTAHRITERKYNYAIALRQFYERQGVPWSG